MTMSDSNDNPAATPGGPLQGIRILDLTAVVLGPLATQLLGDLGADIVKVEPLEGDVLRSNGVSRNLNMGSVFIAMNRNKRSISVELKLPEGKDIVRRLIATSDVVVHNMRIAAAEKLGFGYEDVKAIRPDIVYCVATGFGQDGPDRNKPAFDDIIQAACGLASVNSIGRDEPDYMATLIADKTAGMALSNAVLAALFHRERTGQGQYVEVPMFETMVSFVMAEHLNGLTFDPPKGKAGYTRLLTGGRRPAPTRDGHIAVLPYTTNHWVALLEFDGRQGLVEKYNVRDRDARNTHLIELYREMAEITRTRTTAEWIEIFARLDIPATPLYDLDDLPGHPHLKAVGLFRTAEHPSEGTIRYVAPATRFAASPATVRCHAPQLGQHTSELMREVGFTDEAISQLQGKGVVRRSDGPS